MHEPRTHRTTCCVAGGGPAGMMLGFLLARAGVEVVVLEKHADFLRDFRGDTIHPSTYEMFHELGLLDEILAITDFKAETLKVSVNGNVFDGPTLTKLKDTKCKFIGFAPQWNLLNLLATQASSFPNFDLRMETKATELIYESEKVVGLKCEDEHGRHEILADLVVGADGRSSILRDQANLEVIEYGIPIDALWFRLDRPTDDDGHTIGWLKDGRMLVTIPRKDYYQIAMVIRKGSFDQLKDSGLKAFRETIGIVCPPLKDAATRLVTWDDIKLLSVQMNRLTDWHEPGLLFIGDAAHAMSPVGGVGINLAIQDAVATANILTKNLLKGTVSAIELAAVQRRREPAARKTQRFQAFVHKQLFGGIAGPGKPIRIIWYLRWFLLLFSRWLRPIAGRVIGLGFQPEHIECMAMNDMPIPGGEFKTP